MRLNAIVGAVAIALQAVLALGIAQTVTEVVEVYNDTPIVAEGEEDAFREDVGRSLSHVERALPFAMGGVALAVIAYMALHLRARWFFWSWLAASVVWLVVIPAGTLVGAISIGFLILRRKEFLGTARPA